MKLTPSQMQMLGEAPNTWGDSRTSWTNGTYNALKKRGLVEMRRKPRDVRTFAFDVQWRLTQAGRRLSQYFDYIARLQKNGREKLVSYRCPDCRSEIEALVPSKGQTYDSVVECPYCGKTHYKIVEDTARVYVHTARNIEARSAGGCG